MPDQCAEDRTQATLTAGDHHNVSRARGGDACGCDIGDLLSEPGLQFRETGNRSTCHSCARARGACERLTQESLGQQLNRGVPRMQADGVRSDQPLGRRQRETPRRRSPESCRLPAIVNSTDCAPGADERPHPGPSLDQSPGCELVHRLLHRDRAGAELGDERARRREPGPRSGAVDPGAQLRNQPLRATLIHEST